MHGGANTGGIKGAKDPDNPSKGPNPISHSPKTTISSQYFSMVPLCGKWGSGGHGPTIIWAKPQTPISHSLKARLPSPQYSYGAPYARGGGHGAMDRH